jgi:hypothetical protein
MAFNENTPDEIGKAVLRAAITSFQDGRPGDITPEDLLREAKSFYPANLASPDQIQAIRKQCRHATTAAAQDNSEFRLEPVFAFTALLGKSDE